MGPSKIAKTIGIDGFFAQVIFKETKKQLINLL